MAKNFKELKPVTMKQQKTWESLMHFGKKCGCHQMPSRSFFYKNFQFPLCARCTGIFFGEFFLAPILLLLGYHSLYIDLILLIPIAIDGLLQYYKFMESNNVRRLITGLMAGYALMSLTIYFLILIIRLIL